MNRNTLTSERPIYKRPRVVIPVVAAVALLAGGCSSSPSSSAAANRTSASASATRSPNTAPATSANAYNTALAYIRTLTSKCVGLGSNGKALTTQGGSAGEPTTQNFWIKNSVSDTGGTTSPLIQKAQCNTYEGGVSAHVQLQGGERWSMSATTTESGAAIIYVQHALGKHVIGTSDISPGSTDMSPVTKADTFIGDVMAGATTNPNAASS